MSEAVALVGASDAGAMLAGRMLLEPASSWMAWAGALVLAIVAPRAVGQHRVSMAPSLAGRVVDMGGTPVGGAMVWGRSAVVWTEADGTFRLPQRPDQGPRVDVGARKDGVGEVLVENLPWSSERALPDLVLGGAATLRGVLVLRSGEPVGGLALDLGLRPGRLDDAPRVTTGRRSVSLVTGADGSFAVAGLAPGEYQLAADPRQPAIRGLVARTGDQVHRFVLDAVRVRLVADRDRITAFCGGVIEPQRGDEVTRWRATPPDQRGDRPRELLSLRCVPEPAGHELSLFVPPWHWVLGSVALGSGPPREVCVQVAACGEHVVVVDTGHNSLRFTVHAVPGASMPPDDVTVSTCFDRPLLARPFLNQGVGTLTGLPTGWYRITAWQNLPPQAYCMGASLWIWVGAGETHAVIAPTACGRLLIELERMDADEASTEVIAHPLGRPGTWLGLPLVTGESSSDRSRFGRVLPPGEYQVRILRNGQLHHVETVTVGVGATTVVRRTLEPR